MEYNKNTTGAAATAAAKVEDSPSSLSPTPLASSEPSFPLAPPPPVILSPCGACRSLRRRCVENCVLAPFFPPSEPYKFAIVHRVFGASNVIRLLKELPEGQRADAVNCMVYEGNARLRDPVYGCTGAIYHLQKQISELQAELAMAQAEILNMQCQNANLLEQTQKQMEATQNHDKENLHVQTAQLPYYEHSTNFVCDEDILGIFQEPFWQERS